MGVGLLQGGFEVVMTRCALVCLGLLTMRVFSLDHSNYKFKASFLVEKPRVTVGVYAVIGKGVFPRTRFGKAS